MPKKFGTKKNDAFELRAAGTKKSLLIAPSALMSLPSWLTVPGPALSDFPGKISQLLANQRYLANSLHEVQDRFTALGVVPLAQIDFQGPELSFPVRL